MSESLSAALWLMVSADSAVMLNPLSSERLELGYTLAEQTDMTGTPSFSDDNTSHCHSWLRGKGRTKHALPEESKEGCWKPAFSELLLASFPLNNYLHNSDETRGSESGPGKP